MKKSLIALFILTSVLAFSEGNVKKVPFESMTRTDNGIAYFKDEKTPFTGIVEKKSKDGKLEAVISLKDGKLDGKTFTYYPNGKVQREERVREPLDLRHRLERLQSNQMLIVAQLPMSR